MSYNHTQRKTWRERGWRSKPGPRKRHSGMFTSDDPRINRSGKPKKSPEMKQIEQVCRENAEKAVQLLLDTISNPEAPAAQRLAAAREILDRGFGKPVDRLAVAQLDGKGPEGSDTLTDAALLRIAAGGDGQVIDLKPVSVRTESEEPPPSDLK